MRILSPAGIEGIADDSDNNEPGNDLDYRHRQCAVWASQQGTWKSGKFLVILHHQYIDRNDMDRIRDFLSFSKINRLVCPSNSMGF